MKVPKSIKDKIRECANLNASANILEQEIIEWLQSKHLTEDSGATSESNLDDAFIDCIKIGMDPEWFIKKLENLKEKNNK